MSGLLRICTAGSVDDGKSTLIGRLLYESRALYADQVTAVEAASRHRSAGPIDFSLFTDGLRAEREQGVTIDVAYRYFSTSRRTFILADTPGHEQYTRNMATGASTADVAILLVDARHGVREQTERHARIAGLLGVSTFVIAINKIDLTAFDPAPFAAIRRTLADMLPGAHWHAIPISALHGDNVTCRSPRTPWYEGPSLLEHLETVNVGTRDRVDDFRMAIQLVIRADENFRGYAGRIAAGAVRVGDAVQAWPDGVSSRVRRIVGGRGDLARATVAQSVVIVLDSELAIGRGDVLGTGTPSVATAVDADVVWMDERPLDPRRPYLVKLGTRTVTADLEGSLTLNTIARTRITTTQRVVFDPYSQNRAMGSCIVIDPVTGFTAGAGMIVAAAASGHRVSGTRLAAERLARAARIAADEASAVAVVQRQLEEWLT